MWMACDTTLFFSVSPKFSVVVFFFLTNDYSGAINFWGCSVLITFWKKTPNLRMKLQYNLEQVLPIMALKKNQCLFHLKGTYLCSFSVWWLRLDYCLSWHDLQAHRFTDLKTRRDSYIHLACLGLHRNALHSAVLHQVWNSDLVEPHLFENHHILICSDAQKAHTAVRESFSMP